MTLSRKFLFALLLLSTLLLTLLASAHSPNSENKTECPLASKCPYYSAIHEGKPLDKVDWKNSKCPLAGKCPYYEELQKRAEENGGKLEGLGCPYTEKCPHFKDKDAKADCDEECLKKYKEAHGWAGKDGEPSHVDLSKCPYLKGSKDTEDAASKCPHLQKLKQEQEDKDAAARKEEKRDEL